LHDVGVSPLLLVLLAQVSAHDPIAVVISSKRPGSDTAAQKVATRMTTALASAGFKAPLDDAATVKLLKKQKLNPRDCQGANPCVLKLASALGPTAVLVAVDVGRIGDSLAIHVEAATGDGVARGVLDVPSDVELKSGQINAFDDFARSLAEKLAPTPAIPVAVLPADAPKSSTLTPPPSDTPRVVVARSSGPSTFRRALPWVAGAGAVGALAVSGTFLALGSQDKSAYENSLSPNRVSRLTGSELQAISSQGNTRFTVAMTTAIVGVALAATAGLLFATSE
jgi:hypothetical protein